MKICSKCKHDLPLIEFVKSSYTKDGYKCTCKKCYSKQSTAYYHKNKEKMKAASKAWHDLNKDYNDLRDQSRYHDVNFIPRGRTKGRTRAKALEHAQLYAEKYYQKNRDKLLGNMKASRDRINYTRKQRHLNNKSCKIAHIFRSRLAKFVRKADRLSSMELLGCNFEELCRWLERHFEKDMNWDNYGRGENKWCIDHHFPCASFDLTDPEQQAKCFHYTNLYPMWYIENCRKSAKIPLSKRDNQ